MELFSKELFKKELFKKKKTYPTKTTLNLMIMEQPAEQMRRYLPYLVLFALVLVLFVKFGVIDRMAAASRAELQADAAEEQLDTVQRELADYDAVLEEYTRYFSEALGSGKDVMPLDVMEALALVEGHVMDRTNISSLEFAGKTVTMEITGTGLDRASDLYAELTSLPQVEGVSLFTANTGNSDTVESGATILLTITFQEVEQ